LSVNAMLIGDQPDQLPATSDVCTQFRGPLGKYRLRTRLRHTPHTEVGAIE
jgi:hypothetical protein